MASPSVHFTYATVHGPITLEATDSGLRAVHFGKPSLTNPSRPSTITNQAASQLQEYLAGKRRIFTIPLELEGSDFKRAVWEAVQTIPYGEVATAAAIANLLGRPESFRSVGQALRQNPLAPIIPSHRIVSATTGNATSGLFQGLLALEQRYYKGEH